MNELGELEIGEKGLSLEEESLRSSAALRAFVQG